MKRLILLLGAAALLSAALWGCETTGGNHAYWQARSNAIADLPVEQRVAAYNDMFRDWDAQKQIQKQQSRETWQAIGAGLQQMGAEMQENGAIRQQQGADAVQHCIDNLNQNPALQFHY